MEYHIKMIKTLTEFLGQAYNEAVMKRIVWHKQQLHKYGIFGV